MLEKKILQIMPATVPYWAVYAWEAKNGELKTYFTPVIGWQLVEDNSGYREIEPVIVSDGFHTLEASCDNDFIGLSENTNAEDWQDTARMHIEARRRIKPHPVG